MAAMSRCALSLLFSVSSLVVVCRGQPHVQHTLGERPAGAAHTAPAPAVPVVAGPPHAAAGLSPAAAAAAGIPGFTSAGGVGAPGGIYGSVGHGGHKGHKNHGEKFAWSYQPAGLSQRNPICNVRTPRCNNSIMKTGCEKCTVGTSEVDQGTCTGPLIPCAPEQWVELETGCSVTSPGGGTEQCCGAQGTQSPIAANFADAPVHPTLLPTQFVMGHPGPMSTGPGGKPLKAGKNAMGPLCTSAFFVANQHGMKMSFDYKTYWTRVEQEWEQTEAMYAQGPQGLHGGHGMHGAQGPPVMSGLGGLHMNGAPPEPQCALPVAGWGKGHPLKEVTFHSPSEHTVDGSYFPMEGHFVHMKGDSGLIIAVFMTASLDLETRCGGAGTAAGAPHVQLSPQAELECKSALFFNKIMLRMPYDANHKVVTSGAFIQHEHDEQGNRVPGGAVEAVIKLGEGAAGEFDPYTFENAFVPYMQYFYYYIGSLSTPPCTTEVEWILNPTPVTIFDSSLQKFRRNLNGFQPNVLRTEEDAMSPPLVWHPLSMPGWFTWQDGLGRNSRPVQPLIGLACKAHAGQSVHPWQVKTNKAPECPRVFWRIGSPTTIKKNPIHYLDSSPVWASGVPNLFQSFMSSSASGESDALGSAESLHSMGSGSSGFYMALWKWAFVALFAAVVWAVCSFALYTIKRPSKHKPDDKKGGKDEKGKGDKKDDKGDKKSKSSSKASKSSKGSDSAREMDNIVLVPLSQTMNPLAEVLAPPTPMYSAVPMGPQPVSSGMYPGSVIPGSYTSGYGYGSGPGAVV